MSARELIRHRLGIDQPERDPEYPCPDRAFTPGDPSGICDTDGHYMCRECTNANPRRIAERDE